MTTRVVGIDVAKHTLDIALPLGEGKYRTKAKLATTPEGIAQLLAWMDTHAPAAAVCMEATGIYHEAIAEALLRHGHAVYVVNPARIKAYADSELSRIKTDRTDAKVIARFFLAQQVAHKPLLPWQPLSASQKTLRALVRRLEDLKTMAQMELNRRDVADPAVHASIDQVTATLEGQIRDTEQAIRRHIDDDPDLRDRRALLTSIPGIADTTSAWLLAMLGDMRQYSDVRQVVAHVGLNPQVRESGRWKGHTRISKIGDATLRAKLTMPAISARRHNPILRAFADQLAARHKPNKVILCALMRKLLHLAWGVLKSGKPFDPSFRLA